MQNKLFLVKGDCISPQSISFLVSWRGKIPKQIPNTYMAGAIIRDLYSENMVFVKFDPPFWGNWWVNNKICFLQTLYSGVGIPIYTLSLGCWLLAKKSKSPMGFSSFISSLYWVQENIVLLILKPFIGFWTDWLWYHSID